METYTVAWIVDQSGTGKWCAWSDDNATGPGNRCGDSPTEALANYIKAVDAENDV